MQHACHLVILKILENAKKNPSVA